MKTKGVAVHLQALDTRQWVNCVLEDLSEGGLFARTADVLPVGTKIEAHIQKQGTKRTTKVSGAVIGTQVSSPYGPAGMRVKFGNIDANTFTTLQGLIKEYMPSKPAVPPPPPQLPPRAQVPVAEAMPTSAIPKLSERPSLRDLPRVTQQPVLAAARAPAPPKPPPPPPPGDDEQLEKLTQAVKLLKEAHAQLADQAERIRQLESENDSLRNLIKRSQQKR